MLRAKIRFGDGTIHLIGDLNGYNLETLKLHARGAIGDGGFARVELEIDESDAQIWKRYVRRWLTRMDRAGVPVLVRADTRARGRLMKHSHRDVPRP